MFREMRRKKQQMTEEECRGVLERRTSGVLAVRGDGGYPYAVPLSYVYADGKIYFHCAKTGHKIDAILGDDRVSFCVIDQDEVVQERFTTCFRSVIAFGRAAIVEEDAEKREILRKLAKKYSPDIPEAAAEKEISAEFPAVCIVGITIEHLTGKMAKELLK